MHPGVRPEKLFVLGKGTAAASLLKQNKSSPGERGENEASPGHGSSIAAEERARE